MPTINNVDDLLRRCDLADRSPKAIMCVGVAQLTEWVKSAWNHGRAIGYREAYHAIRTSAAIANADEQANEQERFQVRCAEVLAKKRRSKRGGH